MEEAGRESIAVGMLVAVYTKDRIVRPWIRRVTERDGAQITVLWYSGSYTGSWKPGATSDTIPLDSAIHWDFELTRRGQKLHKCVRVALISKYSELDD